MQISKMICMLYIIDLYRKYVFHGDYKVSQCKFHGEVHIRNVSKGAVILFYTYP